MRPRPALLLAALLLFGAACGRDGAPSSYVARVGDMYLTQADIEEALGTYAEPPDSSAAQQQFVDQWVTRALLYQEAERRDLGDTEAVRRLLDASEQSILIDALIARLYEEEAAEPSVAEIQTYFERNKERLRLREPFVRVRFLTTAMPDSAGQARRLLQQATVAGTADAQWVTLADRFATDAETAKTLGASYFPEQRLLGEAPAVREALAPLRPGELAPVLQVDTLYAVLQLVDRAPVGTMPEPAWVEDELRRRLTIEARKQMLERHVQRLRNEAQTRDALDLP